MVLSSLASHDDGSQQQHFAYHRLEEGYGADGNTRTPCRHWSKTGVRLGFALLVTVGLAISQDM